MTRVLRISLLCCTVILVVGDVFDDLAKDGGLTVEILHVPETKGENLTQIVRKVGHLLGVDIGTILMAVRLPKQNWKKPNRPRPIIAKFAVDIDRDHLVAGAKILANYDSHISAKNIDPKFPDEKIDLQEFFRSEYEELKTVFYEGIGKSNKI